MRATFVAAVTVAVSMTGFGAVAQAAEPPASTCFTYSADQWVQDAFTATAVDCALPHNGEVLGIVQLPADVAAAGYAADSVKAWAFRACQPVAVNYAWTKTKPKYPKSSYVMPRSARLNVQLPTVDEWNASQRWAACLGQSRNQKLTAPASRTGSVKGKGLKPYVCLNPRGWRGMKCSKPDAVKLTNQVWISVAQYPGTNKMLTKTQKSCQKLRKKGWTLRTWYVPGAAAWDRGNHYGFCEFVK